MAVYEILRFFTIFETDLLTFNVSLLLLNLPELVGFFGLFLLLLFFCSFGRNAKKEQQQTHMA